MREQGEPGLAPHQAFAWPGLLQRGRAIPSSAPRIQGPEDKLKPTEEDFFYRLYLIFRTDESY
jgi:hypothetical protein